jgi:hypothetical protein
MKLISILVCVLFFCSCSGEGLNEPIPSSDNDTDTVEAPNHSGSPVWTDPSEPELPQTNKPIVPRPSYQPKDNHPLL